MNMDYLPAAAPVAKTIANKVRTMAITLLSIPLKYRHFDHKLANASHYI